MTPQKTNTKIYFWKEWESDDIQGIIEMYNDKYLNAENIAI